MLVTASIALGFWDRWRNGPPAAWEKSEGTQVSAPDPAAVAAFAPPPGDEELRAREAAEPFAAGPAGLPRAVDVARRRPRAR